MNNMFGHAPFDLSRSWQCRAALPLSVMAVAYIVLYLANIRPFGNVSLYHPISLPLVILGVAMLIRPWGWADVAAICLLMWIAFLAAAGSPDLGSALEVMAMGGVALLIRFLPAPKAAALPTACFAFLAASCLMFVLSVTTRWGLGLRRELYAGAVIDPSQLELSVVPWFHQGGLTLYLFSFGYHVAAAVPVALGLAVATSGWRSILWGFASLIALFSLVAAGQRSALLAAGFGIAALAPIMRWRARPAMFGLTLVATAVLVGGVSIQGATGARASAVARALSANSDAGDRFAVQATALRVIANYPLGLNVHARPYEGTMLAFGAPTGIAPHNAYLTRTLWYGWTALAVAASLFGVVALNAIGTWRRVWLCLDQNTTIEIVLLSALIGVLVNACFHNGGFLSLSSHTVAPLMIYLAWRDRVQEGKLCAV